MFSALACSPLEQADGGLVTLGMDDATSGDVGVPTTGVTDDDDDDDDNALDDDTGAQDDDTGGPPGGCQGDEECPPGDSCVAGLCIGDPCPEGEPCDPMVDCRAGAYACVNGEPQCSIAGPAPPGVSCGMGQVCDVDGNCVDCMDGLPCEPDPCQLGTIACGGGQPECIGTGPAPQDTICELAMFCDGAGTCGPAEDCAAILALDETVPTGIYPVDLDGPGGNDPFDVLCDMDTDGGGWTLWASEAMNDLPSNSGLPRCAMGLPTDCYAGTFAGRGDAEGLFFVSAGGTSRLGEDLVWSAVTAENEHLGPCDEEPAPCPAGEGACLFSFVGDGADCCTTMQNMNNFCLE